MLPHPAARKRPSLPTNIGEGANFWLGVVFYASDAMQVALNSCDF